MKFYPYIVCWDAVHENVVNIESSFKSLNVDHSIVNSGNKTRDGWKDVGDIRYYRQLHWSLGDYFLSGKSLTSEYFGFICGIQS